MKQLPSLDLLNTIQLSPPCTIFYAATVPDASCNRAPTTQPLLVIDNARDNKEYPFTPPPKAEFSPFNKYQYFLKLRDVCRNSQRIAVSSETLHFNTANTE